MIYEDIEELLKLGKIKGGLLDCVVVICGDKIFFKEGLCFKDEFVCYKILDIIGDIVLLGMLLKVYIIVMCLGYVINVEFIKVFVVKFEEKKKGLKKKLCLVMVMFSEILFDICCILDMLLYCYLFVMFDCVMEFIGDDVFVVIKNVSINELFF